MAWNPSAYLEFESHRTRPVFELAARVPLKAPTLIYDLGCGPGNSAAVLRDLWPAARIVGVDNSAEMLERARASLPGIEWVEADISRWQPDAPPDLIFANASLQWVSGPEALLRRLISLLAKGGVLAFQVPANLDGPPHTLIDEALAEAGLAERVRRGDLSRYVLAPAAYYRVLAPLAASVDIWDTDYLQVMSGEDPVLNWIRGTALVPITSVLRADERERFLAVLAPLLRRAYAREADGDTLFAFRRRFVVAIR
jgi:trans-aconitate 2-methyltransferase